MYTAVQWHGFIEEYSIATLGSANPVEKMAVIALSYSVGGDVRTDR